MPSDSAMNFRQATMLMMSNRVGKANPYATALNPTLAEAITLTSWPTAYMSGLSTATSTIFSLLSADEQCAEILHPEHALLCSMRTRTLLEEMESMVPECDMMLEFIVEIIILEGQNCNVHFAIAKVIH